MSTRRLAFGFALLFSSTLVPAAAGPKKQYTIEQFMATTSVGGASFSAGRDARSCSRRTRPASSTCTACRWRAARPPRSRARPRTRPTRCPTSPHDDRVLFTRDQGGNELNHLYVRGAGRAGEGPHPGREAEGASSRAGRRRGTPSGCSPTSAIRASSTSTATTRRPTRARCVYKDETGLSAGRRSPTTARYVALRQAAAPPSDSDIYLWDARTKEMKHLTPHQGQAAYSGGQDFDPASQGALLPDQRGRRVHARAALRPRQRPPRGRGEGGLGRHVHVLLAAADATASPRINDDGAHRDQAARRDGRARR